jgi:DNA polymerase III delta prime subunit
MASLTNFYEHKGVKKYMKDNHNPNFNIHHIKVPFRMLIIGASGTGKTSTLLNLIKVMSNTFTRICIITKDKAEPLYQYLYDATGGKHGNVTIENFDEKGLPDLKEFHSDQNSLIVMDDLVNQSAKEQKPICDYFIRARKKGVSLVYISQSFYAIPKMIRNNVSYIILKQVSSQRNLQMIVKDFSIGISKDKAMELYKDATQDFTSFLLLDLDNPKQPFRKGFDQFYELE